MSREGADPRAPFLRTCRTTRHLWRGAPCAAAVPRAALPPCQAARTIGASVGASTCREVYRLSLAEHQDTDMRTHCNDHARIQAQCITAICMQLLPPCKGTQRSVLKSVESSQHQSAPSCHCGRLARRVLELGHAALRHAWQNQKTDGLGRRQSRPCRAQAAPCLPGTQCRPRTMARRVPSALYIVSGKRASGKSAL